MKSPSNPSYEHQEVRIARQRRNDKIARFGSVMIVIFTSLSQWGHQLWVSNSRASWFWVTIFACVGVLVTGFIARPLRRPQMRVRMAPEVLSTDQRAPVVYLRPFETDLRNHWYESRIMRSMGKVGPVVTIGRPDEMYPATLHIAREYPHDEKWRQRIIDLTNLAQLVIVYVGTSEGLAWEIEQIIRQDRPGKLIICLGHDMVPRLVSAPESGVEYRQFFERFNSIFPKGLPTNLRSSVFVAFGPDWMPVLSRESNTPSGINHPLGLHLQRLHQKLIRFRLA